MKIIDITMPLADDLPTFPGDPPVRIEPVSRIERGDPANLSRIAMGSHSGTHLDAPRHFTDRGMTVDELPLDLLMGEVRVLDLRGVRSIGSRELGRLPVKGAKRIILKTDNSRLWREKGFTDAYAHLTGEGARHLWEAGVRLVGIDYLSVEAFAGDGEVHRILLEGGGVILEGLNLEEVEPGAYELVCLPLKLKGGDGAPARAVLLKSRDPEAGAEFEAHTSRWPLS